MHLSHKTKQKVYKFFGFIWPKMGLSRFFKYLLIKLKRMPGKPYSIAVGFACGVFASFTPFVGFHLILSALLATLLKGSIIASFVGTVVGNPWTFPIIWFSTYRFGLFLMDIYRTEFEIQSVNFIHLFQHFFTSLIQWDIDKFKSEIVPIWWPMMIGSLPLGLMAAVSVYIPLKKMISGYHKHREIMREKKRLGLSKKREIKAKIANIYKKIKRIIRNRYKSKWKKNAKTKAYARRITRRLRTISNRRYIKKYRKKKLKGRFSLRLKNNIKNAKKANKSNLSKTRKSNKKKSRRQSLK